LELRNGCRQAPSDMDGSQQIRDSDQSCPMMRLFDQKKKSHNAVPYPAAAVVTETQYSGVGKLHFQRRNSNPSWMVAIERDSWRPENIVDNETCTIKLSEVELFNQIFMKTYTIFLQGFASIC
jgi:hypothetical protein